ncbi:MAG: hypothetical protein GX898_04825 [Corynebacterium sp.]|nr:hypothetical protein [Corynebacterium sp.]
MEATVKGSHVHRVNFQLRGTPVDTRCTCPHFDDGNFCKHLVAVGLVAGGATEPAP